MSGPFKMKGWSPFTDKQTKSHANKYGSHSDKLTTRSEHENAITKAHNITEEKFNPTGDTCMICGNQRDDHHPRNYNEPKHKFKSSGRKQGEDPKDQNADEVD